MIKGLNHFNIATADLEKSAKFYEQFGMQRGHRPGFETTGIWLYVDGVPILHLNDEIEVGPIKKGTGAFHHVGVSVGGSVEEVCANLTRCGITFDLWDPIPGCHRALYFKGPSDESIEMVLVDCPVAELENAG